VRTRTQNVLRGQVQTLRQSTHDELAKHSKSMNDFTLVSTRVCAVSLV
jgi:hypothetical protein